MLPLDHIIVSTIPKVHAYTCGFCHQPLALDSWDACPCRTSPAPPTDAPTETTEISLLLGEKPLPRHALRFLLVWGLGACLIAAWIWLQRGT